MSITVDGFLAANVVFFVFNSGVAVGLFWRKIGEMKRNKRATTARSTTKKSR